MESQNFFEIFNHFIETRDPIQLLALADDIEVFGSASFGDGKTYIGEQAPEKFREAISITRNAKSELSLDIKHAIVDRERALYFLNVKRGRKSAGSALDIIVSDGKLTCFHEAPAKV